jgi:predicted site-specific integrase-resolvase
MNRHVLSGPEVANLLGIQEQTLRAWRVKGNGPVYVRFGGPRGRVRYRLEDVETWLTDQRYKSTSEETVNAEN